MLQKREQALKCGSNKEKKSTQKPVYKTEINGRGDSLRWPRDTPSIR
jgi:hypothetical protein